MGRPRLELVNKRFGKLTVISFFGIATNKRKSLWNCICDCGVEKVIDGERLTSGNTQSCGCLRKEQHTTHGMSGMREYKIWCAMKNRCLNINASDYAYYGGRGIYICERWLEFQNFFEDMGCAPAHMTIDRINNDGPYTPENCHWATREQQGFNQRSNISLTYNGRTLTIGQWAKELGVKYPTIYARYFRGWPVKDIFDFPGKKVV